MLTPHLEIERWNTGHLVVGIDEAGRGALAGPVAAAAVVFPLGRIPEGMQDSKKLSADMRAQLASVIKESALAWSVVLVHHDRIDSINILQATFDAMHMAIDDLVNEIGEQTNLDLLVDGNRFRPHRLPWSTIIGGDGVSPTIAAASILAKTTRDAWMESIDAQYPAYGFAQHKGYGTAVHRAALRQHGASDIHRRSFLRNLLSQHEPPRDNG